MVEIAVKFATHSDGRLITRPLRESDRARFLHFLFSPPADQYLSPEVVRTTDFRFYKSRTEEGPSTIRDFWSEKYPGWFPIREKYNHMETRFIYWILYGVDVHHSPTPKTPWIRHQLQDRSALMMEARKRKRESETANENFYSPASPPLEDQGPITGRLETSSWGSPTPSEGTVKLGEDEWE